MSSSIDPHKILAVQPGVSLDQLQKAYRRAAAKHHPDAGGDVWAFQQVQQAYETLLQKIQQPQMRQVSAEQYSSATPANAQPSASGTSKSDASSADSKEPSGWLERLAHSPSGLRDEASYFLLANFMDIVMTGILLRFSAVEANPIANYVLQRFGFSGMVGFKIASVALVCLIAFLIATRSQLKARLLLLGGTLVVSAVVVYSMFLARRLVYG